MDELETEKTKPVRKRRGLIEGQALVQSFRESGLSRPQFCKQSGVGLPVLAYWIARTKQVPARSRATFLPVRIEPVEATKQESLGAIGVKFGQVQCSIPCSLGPEFVADVIRRLSGQAGGQP